jgi:hypothetical protein
VNLRRIDVMIVVTSYRIPISEKNDWSINPRLRANWPMMSENSPLGMSHAPNVEGESSVPSRVKVPGLASVYLKFQISVSIIQNLSTE